MTLSASSPVSSLQAALSAQGYAGTLGLVILDLQGRVLRSEAATRVFPAASTIKLPLLILALQLAQRGELDLDQPVTLRADDQVPGAGVLHELSPGLQLCWRDLLRLMIIVSDNTATNLVIGRLGMARVQDWLADHLPHTRLVGLLQVAPERRTPAQRRGERNSTTPADQAGLLLALLRGELLTPPYRDLALEILGRQQDQPLLGRYLPRDSQGRLSYRLASKSGQLRGIRHDVGVLYTPRPLIVAALSEGGLDPREHPENRDTLLLARTLWPVLASLGQIYADQGDI